MQISETFTYQSEKREVTKSTTALCRVDPTQNSCKEAQRPEKERHRERERQGERESIFHLRLAAEAVLCFLLPPVLSLQTGTQPWRAAQVESKRGIISSISMASRELSGELGGWRDPSLDHSINKWKMQRRFLVQKSYAGESHSQRQLRASSSTFTLSTDLLGLFY